MEADERVRLFCALRLPDDVLDAVVAWQHRVLTDGRIVPRGNLHLTAAFLGHRPVGELPAVVEALRTAAASARPMRLVVERYRETRSVGMLVCSDEEGAGASFAADLQARLAAAGVYEPEGRRWLPHLTVLRFREPPRLHPPLPELPPFAPSDAAAYLSRLRPGGAQYEVLESAPLGG
ncbi:MAG: 2'-5' RNA ligase family protein [Gaiellaceae bacterium]